jgi:hypothetical protein
VKSESIDVPLCACGCGLQVKISKHCRPEYGHQRNKPYKFLAGHYRRLYSSRSYPVKRDGSSLKAVHQMRAEKALGKKLPDGAEVHHADCSKSADAQLVICPNVAYHKFLHIRTRIQRAGGDPNAERLCRMCKLLKPISAFVKTKTYCEVDTKCKRCANIEGKANRDRRIALVQGAA